MVEKYDINQRRLRSGIHMRELAATVRLSHRMFIQPFFVEEHMTTPREVEGLSGILVHTESTIVSVIESYMKGGVTKFLFFPIPATRSTTEFNFSFATKIISLLKHTFGEAIWLATDLCLCSYTTHGHCGLLSTDGARLLNDKTVTILARYALELAQAGTDCIAPSDMMDGRIHAIRQLLNRNDFDYIAIMSYGAKFSSQFYGPFRDACHSAPAPQQLNDRKTYQISSANLNDALTTAVRDANEGADIIMVKPAAHYGDVIAALRARLLQPIAAYHVSGEYAALELLVKNGLATRAALHLETWTAMARAGAGIIISYAACHAKEWIEKEFI